MRARTVLQSFRSLGPFRRAGRSKSLVTTIGMCDNVRSYYATFEPALDGNRFALGCRDAIFASRAGINKRAAGGVLQDELVAEDVRDFALDRDRRTFGHLVDAGRL